MSTQSSQSSSKNDSPPWWLGILGLAVFWGLVMAGRGIASALPKDFPIYPVFVLAPCWGLIPGLILLSLFFSLLKWELLAKCFMMLMIPAVIIAFFGVVLGCFAASEANAFPYDLMHEMWSSERTTAYGNPWNLFVFMAFMVIFFILLPFSVPFFFFKLINRF